MAYFFPYNAGNDCVGPDGLPPNAGGGVVVSVGAPNAGGGAAKLLAPLLNPVLLDPNAC